MLVGATGIEQGVFETIASVFDSCKGAAQGSSCDHEHAGFMKVFQNVNTTMQRDLKRIFGNLDFAEIAREISKSQKFDTLSKLV